MLAGSSDGRPIVLIELQNMTANHGGVVKVDSKG